MPDLLSQLASRLKKKGWKFATAESCTGGLLAATITSVPGISEVFERGFVTYSNESKMELLKVSDLILRDHGAVSAECAKAMVKGALKYSQASVAVSITGIAGPDGGTDAKPVGTVFIGYGTKDNGEPEVTEHHFQGDRQEIRMQSVKAALEHAVRIAG